MRLGRNLGIFLLAVWLILIGLVALLNLSIPAVILAVIAIVAGVLILFDLRSTPRNLGYLLLGIWLIIRGLIDGFGLSFTGIETIMAILAIAAGVLILLRR